MVFWLAPPSGTKALTLRNPTNPPTWDAPLASTLQRTPAPSRQTHRRPDTALQPTETYSSAVTSQPRHCSPAHCNTLQHRHVTPRHGSLAHTWIASMALALSCPAPADALLLLPPSAATVSSTSVRTCERQKVCVLSDGLGLRPARQRSLSCNFTLQECGAVRCGAVRCLLLPNL